MTHNSVPLLTYQRFLLTCFTAIVIIFCSGCSWVFAPEEKTEAPAQPALQAELPSSPVTPPEPQVLTSDIEVVWLVPEQEVDRFVIEYGFKQHKLDQKVELEPRQLQITNDPKYGRAYRYLLHNLPKKQEIFLMLRSVKGEMRSDPTPIVSVEAQ